jgi:choline kinase
MKVVILAAGIGSRLRPYTEEIPKSLVPLNSKPMLAHILDAFKDIKVDEFVIVTGYRENFIREFFETRSEKVSFVYNDRYDTAGNGYSLLVAKDAVNGDSFFKIDSDLIFVPEIAQRLLDAKGDIRVTVDVKENMGDEEMKVSVDSTGRINDFSKEMSASDAWGETIGLEFITPKGGELLFAELKKVMDDGLVDAYYEEAYGRLARNGTFLTATQVLDEHKWYEIDNEEDLKNATELFKN